MLSLLDVNVLIALLDENHVHHPDASTWFSDHVDEGWASCPITQNGCLRIVSHPRYPNGLEVADAISRLRAAVSTPYHRFIPDDISLLDEDVIDRRHLLGHRQLTDAYLLALAVAHDARLVTLDKSVPVATVRAAGDSSLLVI